MKIFPWILNRPRYRRTTREMENGTKLTVGGKLVQVSMGQVLLSILDLISNGIKVALGVAITAIDDGNMGTQRNKSFGEV